MTEEETITVAEVSEGPGGSGTPGEHVDLPVVELLTGRGFVTGKSGSGKSNTASVVVERLLDGGFPVLIVDADGEYYGLKEEYEVLHAGADEECDITVSPEHAGKIADLALDGNVPIVLDVSGYLDDSVASELVLEVTRHLFAKEKKLKKPFLMLVEECHEYIPEGAGLDETGKMLVKVGKRGRKHGLGIVGISQRPADVKKDFITQCDWLVWHRLTWRNDTKVVRRILGGEYADAVEDLGDGEGFLVTDWSESIRRVQFDRKETFDAGATPGLDDVERPDLKSVSDDLVAELRDISEESQRRESELADLRTELERKEDKIAQLKRELEEARDLKRMADRFSQALLERADAPYRDVDVPVGPAYPGDDADVPTPPRGRAAGDAGGEESARAGTGGSTRDGEATAGPEATAASDGTVQRAARANGWSWPGVGPDEDGEGTRTDATGNGEAAGSGATTGTTAGTTEAARPDGERGTGAPGGDSVAGLSGREAVEAVRRRVLALDPIARGMLDHYRERGVSDPVSAHVAAGGDGDRERAYARNRRLRREGLVSHAGGSSYEYALEETLRETHADRLWPAELGEAVAAVEAVFEGDDAGSD